MADGLMQGMVVAATLLSSTAILLSVGIVLYVVRMHREERGEERAAGGESDGSDGAPSAPRALAAEDG